MSAEILRLARLLRCEPDRLAYLEKIPESDLRELREQITEMLFSAENQTLEKLAAASRLLPVALISAMTQRAFGPILAARIAGLLEPSRAVDVAARLPAPFLAETAREIDPRRTSAVIAGIPPERIAEIARVLAANGDFVTMGQAVGQLSEEALAAALDVLDDEMLLRTAFVAEDKARLSDLASLLGHDRLVGMIDVAQAAGLDDEAIDLLEHLDESSRAELLEAVRQRDEKTHRLLLARLATMRAKPAA